REYGDLQGTCDFLEDTILHHINENNFVFDLTLGPTLVTLAMAKLAREYSITAFHVSSYDAENAEISYY
ncbi:MAG: hypothetical protein ACFFCP_02145, partial [Promethearchaeota archaeon]